ncbi:MAG: hypothetical protein K8R79_07155, partial [Calditrichales bacterium]|nr:hypothetical protein [Calditrichales bacterium]
SGAFNAEYGNAMSGVVNFTTKDGSSNIKTFLSFYTGDYISGNNDIFTNIDDVNPLANYNVEGTLSGPIFFLGKNHTFFFSVRHRDYQGYLYGIREHLTTDSANFELKPVVETYKDDEEKNVTVITYVDDWYIERNGDNVFVPMNPSKGLNLLGKFKFQLMPTMNLRIQTLVEQSDWKEYVHSYKYNPDGIYSYHSLSFNNSLQLTHTLSANTFYEFKAAFNSREYTKYAFEDINDPRYAPTDKIKGSPSGSTFLFGGTQRDHIYENSKSYLSKFDFTSQVNKQNLIKAGIEARLHVLDRENFYIGYDRDKNREPTKLYGGIYIRYPCQVSTYLQDKLEYDDMIINAGLRYDYFYADAQYALDELQPDGQREQAEAKHMLVPRLGISFPITETGIIHLSYGHFYQMPSLRNLYSNPYFLLPASGTPEFGNADLNPEKTIMYEIGLQQQFGDQIALDITGFYKDIRNLLAWQTIMFNRLEGDRQEYRIRRNQDYANVKGLTLTLEKRMTKASPVSASIAYTFQIAEGNDNEAASFYYNSLSGLENVKEIIPLDWDQLHNLYGSVAVTPIDGLTMSMIGKLSAGYPYTPYIPSSNYDSKPNSTRKPTQKSVDVKISYRFKFFKMYYQVFVKAYNLFDSLNERYVYNDTGKASYTFADRSIDEPEGFIKHYGEPGVHTYDEYINRPHYYRSPRQIRIGLSVEL